MTHKTFRFFKPADVVAAITAEPALSQEARHGLTELVMHPGPGTWSRTKHVRVGPRRDRLDDVWKGIAPHRSRHATPKDYIKQMTRGQVPQAHVFERESSPSLPRDVWDLVATVLALYPDTPVSGA